MKQTGELLRKTREQKNLSLHEIGMSLKINPKTLQAIESADISKLPQKAFVRGFVKSYAQFLKMDVASVLELLAKEDGQMAQQQSQETRQASVDAKREAHSGQENTITNSGAAAHASSPLHTRAVNPIEKPHPFLNSNSIAAFLIGLVLIASVILVSKLVSKYQKERGSEVAKQELIKSQEPAAAPTNSSAEMPPPPVDGLAASATAPSSDPTLSMLTGGAQSSAKTETTSSTKKSERNTTTKETKASDKADEKPAEVAPIPTHPQEVIVEALKSVTIAYRVGSAKPETLEMSAGEIHAFKSKSLIDLDINDGSAINIIVNGRDRGTPSKQAKSLHLVYPK